ncbi:hypothetical protein [Planctomicrobium sp. SH664]|uniref:hypothetical protein n=1 Tax=Planctomicrobium sp. SH664 TaxID=3448125 RepID=UPI003F5AEBB9
MPTPQLILGTFGVALLVSLVVDLCGALLTVRRSEAVRRIVPIVGLALGLIAGLIWMSFRPHWPPREDQDRLALLLLPGLLLLELLAGLTSSHQWLGHVLRLGFSVVTLPVLLWGSVYVPATFSGSSTSWPEFIGLLTAAAAALAAVWFGLLWSNAKSGGRGNVLLVSVVLVAAGLMVMLSGYASGGVLAFPLSGTIAGCWLAALIWKKPDFRAATSFGVVGVFSILAIGVAFGELPLRTAGVFWGPLGLSVWCDLLFRTASPRRREAMRFALVLLPVLLSTGMTVRQFAKASAVPAPSGAPSDVSVDDYLNYRP